MARRFWILILATWIGSHTTMAADLPTRELRGVDLVIAAAEIAGSPLHLLDRRVLKFLAACDELQNRTPADAQRVLHDRILTGTYRDDINDVAKSLECGDYNCLTATILYQALCDQNKIAVRPCATTRHVACRTLKGDWIEPTCPDWWERTEHPTREITDRGIERPEATIRRTDLLARAYFNCGTEALADGSFMKAVECFKNARHMAPLFTAARDNELAALNRLALAHCEQGQYALADEALQSARELDAKYRATAANESHVFQRWTTALCREGRFDEALHVLEVGRDRNPGTEISEHGPLAVTQAWLKILLQKGDQEGAELALAGAVQRFPELVSLRTLLISAEKRPTMKGPTKGPTTLDFQHIH